MKIVSRAALSGLLIAAVLSGCGEAGQASSDIEGNCPSVLTVGVPTVIELRVTNTGKKDWPVAYLTFTRGLDSFVVEGSAMRGSPGQSADTPALDTFAFAGGLKAGKTARMRVAATPKDAGNVDLRFGAWGSKPDERLVPSDLEVASCADLAIRPRL